MLGAEGRDQLAGRAEGDHATVVDDGDTIAEALRLFHVMRGQEDGAAGLLELEDEIPELPSRLGIEAGGRLVEKQQLGMADQRGGHRQPLLLAT